jgi:hypothetical protein
MRYFIHPESCCAWSQEDHVEAPSDISVEEVEKEQFFQACAAWGIDPEEVHYS